MRNFQSLIQVVILQAIFQHIYWLGVYFFAWNGIIIKDGNRGLGAAAWQFDTAATSWATIIILAP